MQQIDRRSQITRIIKLTRIKNHDDQHDAVLTILLEMVGILSGRVKLMDETQKSEKGEDRQ